MKITTRKLFLLVTLVTAGLLTLLAVRASKRLEVALADGTMLRLERIDYGKKRLFEIKPWRKHLETVKEILPNWISQHLPPSTYVAARTGGTLSDPGKDALYVWMTRYDPKSSKHVDVGWMFAEIIDEHGCRFLAAQSGATSRRAASNSRTYDVGWFSFQAFPRRQDRMRLRLYDKERVVLTEFEIANPAKLQPLEWEAEPFPITQTNGAVAFRLSNLDLTKNVEEDLNEFQTPRSIVPVFDVVENGMPTDAWKPVQTELSDSAGNIPSQYPFKSSLLCRFEPAWRLRTQFCGDTSSLLASNSCWTLPDLKFPQPGSYTALSTTQQIANVSLNLIGLAGPGHTTYSNDIPVSAAVLQDLDGRDYEVSSRGEGVGGRMTMIYEVKMRTPHIALIVSGLQEDQWISIEATDENGRKSFAKKWEWSFPSTAPVQSVGPYLHPQPGEHSFLGLDSTETNGKLRLNFCIHQARTADFFIHPPH